MTSTQMISPARSRNARMFRIVGLEMTRATTRIGPSAKIMIPVTRIPAQNPMSKNQPSLLLRFLRIIARPGSRVPRLVHPTTLGNASYRCFVWRSPSVGLRVRKLSSVERVRVRRLLTVARAREPAEGRGCCALTWSCAFTDCGRLRGAGGSG